jgi:hypothetical protein
MRRVFANQLHKRGLPHRHASTAGLGIAITAATKAGSDDGLWYRYNGYSYDQFADAMRYARLTRSRPSQQETVGPFAHGQTVEPPSEAGRKLMALMSIRFEAGAYRFETFRYDRLPTR